MEPTIALFDIDGTLLRAGGAGRRAVELALCEVLEDDNGSVSLESVEFAGRTDPWIVRTALMQYGVTANDALIHEVLRRYVAHLPRELELASAFEVLPGVLSLLAELTVRDDVVLGLGTGNTQPASEPETPSRQRMQSWRTEDSTRSFRSGASAPITPIARSCSEPD
jgi:phosphoglycolate phosphatase-like HAD superfamily hydrolase